MPCTTEPKKFIWALGIITQMVWDLPERREEAILFRWYLSSAAFSFTSNFVASLIRGLSFNALETVPDVSFNSRAISCMVIFCDKQCNRVHNIEFSFAFHPNFCNFFLTIVKKTKIITDWVSPSQLTWLQIKFPRAAFQKAYYFSVCLLLAQLHVIGR